MLIHSANSQQLIFTAGYNHNVSDRLYFSCRINTANKRSAAKIFLQFGKMLGAFPFSKLAKRGPVLRVYAVNLVEAPVFEREFPVSSETGEIVADIIESAREFMQSDCACEVDTFWDLWQFDGDWTLRPAPVTLSCYGPDFEKGDHDDDLRIEFGPDSRFLPMPGVEGSLRMGQSNLKSLLHLVGDLERTLDLKSRQVWSESGANFAEVLKQALGSYSVN
jgi:hypothetical protein